MPFSFIETKNKAAPDYPYLLFDAINLIARSHFHQEIEITEIVSGEITVIRDGQKLLLHQGDILVIMPEEIHSYLPSESHVHVMKLHAQHSLEQTDLSQLRIPTVLSPDSHLGQVIHLAIEEIQRENEQRLTGYGFAISQNCSYILREILRSDLCVRRAQSEQKKHNVSMTVLETVHGYIRAHYTEPISLDVIASVCGLSPYYFAHLFKESTGTTFFNYLTAYRCDKATALLLSERKSMIDVALSCGFSDVRAFNRAFKRIYGQTPSEYRNQIH